MRPRSAGASGTPLSVAATTSATQSTNVLDPGARQVKLTVDVVRTAGPVRRSVRSTAMS